MTTRYITEGQFQVTLKTANMQTMQKVVSAPSQQIAIYRATQAYPNMQFVEVTAEQLDAQAGPQGQQQPGANTPTGTGQLPGFKPLQPLQGLQPLWPQSAYQQAAQQAAQQGAQQQQEAALPVNPRMFRYPYSISLPHRFQRTLKETAPGQVYQNSGQYAIILEDMSEMRNFLHNLVRHRDRDGVRIILAGIRSSMG